jgi:hypothetical protein
MSKYLIIGGNGGFKMNEHINSNLSPREILRMHGVLPEKVAEEVIERAEWTEEYKDEILVVLEDAGRRITDALAFSGEGDEEYELLAATLDQLKNLLDRLME